MDVLACLISSCVFLTRCVLYTHISDHTTGPDGVVEGHPVLVVRVLPWGEDILEAYVVRSFIDHPESTLHPDGVAAAEVSVQVTGVAAALMEASLEVPVLIEDELEYQTYHFVSSWDVFKFHMMNLVIHFSRAYLLHGHCQ